MPTKIDHLGIAVHNLETGLAFYRDLLGLEAEHFETVANEGVKLAMLPTVDSRLELLEPIDESSPIARFLAKQGPGIHHLALKVDNLSQTVEKLVAGGARVLHPPRIGAGGHTYVFVHPKSTGGVLLEIIQN